ncbi:MAG: AAA family ATPase [Syntrophales bacterium]|nr:AAA family ATPase [Syntrophales bacterium]
MYYEYWGLRKPPFDNVPDPSMYVDSHVSMENAIAETIFAIEEGGESVAVIVGDVGLGKTLSLRMIIDSLDQEKYKITLITNPSITFSQLVKEIIGQLTGKPCDKARKVDLLEIFNKILFETIDEGKKVLIFIDEANAISPANLENLRLLTNMQDDQRNLFTMVLAGQSEFARRLEHPRRANLFQRVGTYNKIEKIQSEALLKAYAETRVKLAGGTRKIFTDDVFNPLWKHSEHGVPRLINKICKLSLKAGETNGLELVTGEMIDQIGQRFQRSSGSVSQKRRPRKRFGEEVIEKEALMRELEAEEVLGDHEKHITVPFMEDSDSRREPAPVEKPASVENVTIEEKGQPHFVFEKVESNKLPPCPGETTAAEHRKSAIVEIGDMRATVSLPPEILKQAGSCSSREHRVKLAGVMAARFLQQHPNFTSSPLSDPVDIWGKIRESVLNMLEEEKKLGVM